MGTVPGTVPKVVWNATAKATLGPASAAAFHMSCAATPTVIPIFACRAIRAMMGKLIQQVICTSTLAMDLRTTVKVNRAAICRPVLKPIPALTSHGGTADSERERRDATPVFNLLKPN